MQLHNSGQHQLHHENCISNQPDPDKVKRYKRKKPTKEAIHSYKKLQFLGTKPPSLGCALFNQVSNFVRMPLAISKATLGVTFSILLGKLKHALSHL